MSDVDIKEEENKIDVIFEEDIESEEPPAEEWSSLICLATAPEVNLKQLLYEQGLYKPPSSEICAKYITPSDSSIYRHPLYPYPAIPNPGIENALLKPMPSIIYPDDGQELYLSICKEMGEVPVKIFYNGLLKSHINLAYYCVSPMGFRAMALALRNNRQVQSIDFTENFISLDGCFHFGDIVLENTALKEICFYGCKMGSEGMKRLAKNFAMMKTLKKVNLGSNDLKDEGAKFLIDAIYRGSKIANINLSYNSLTSQSVENLALAIEINTNRITHLNLSWNNISIPKYLEMLAGFLIENKNFVEMDLSWNSLSNRFSKAITLLLKVPNLKVLKLSNNNFDDTAVTAFGICLHDCKKLNTLDLSGNPLTLNGAKGLLRYMALRRVKLSNLLLDDVYVDEEFMVMRSTILSLHFRKDAVITYGLVSSTIKVKPPDMREVVIKRAEFLCSKPKKKAVNVPVMLLQLNKLVKGEPVMEKSLAPLLRQMGALQINDELAEAFSIAFPGPKKGKFKTCSISALADYVRRKWPEAKLPPTPMPESATIVAAKGKVKDAKGNKK